MLIPLGTDRPLRRPTLTTYALIAVNVLVFLADAVAARTAPDAHMLWYANFWLNPHEFKWAGLITYQFLHGDFLHLLGNMIFLYVFGPNVEDRLGRWWYILFYLLGGAAAGGLHVLFDASGAPVVGASGSIAAVTGAFLVLFPRTHVKVFLFFIFIGIFEWPATWFIGIAIARDVFSHAFHTAGNVAVLAHIGGYIFGAAVALVLLAAKIIPREPYDLFSMGKHAHRRRQFKELASRSRSAWTHEAAQQKLAPRATKDAVPDELAALRAEVSRAATGGRVPEAADLYLRIVEQTGGAVMSRDVQILIGNHFATSQRYPAASTAYEAFLKRYPDDREAPHIRLMLALICARYLNDPVRAKQLLDIVRRSPFAEQHRELLDTLTAELG